MKNLPCIINGVHYKSGHEAARILKIDYGTLRYRMRSPNFPEYISKYHPKKVHRSRNNSKRYVPCSIAGVQYKSIKLASRDVGLPQHEIKRRLTSFDYPDYVCDKHPKKESSRKRTSNSPRYPCTIDGIDYESESAAAEALGISTSGVRLRLRSPNFPEYVSKYRPKKQITERGAGYPCTINGVDYETIKAAADALGLIAVTVRNRLLSPKYPEYVSEHLQKKDQIKTGGYPCTINGVDYESETAASKALGINVIPRIISSNFPEYVSKHRPKRKCRASVSCTVAGVEYKTIGKASKDLRISYNEMIRRFVSLDFPDYVCNKYPKEKRDFRYKVKGKLYKTLQEAAKGEGVSIYLISQRLENSSNPDYQRL